MITSTNILSGSSIATFHYRDTVAGNPTITAASSTPTAVTSASQVETVTAGAATKIQVETAADGSGTVVPAQSLNSGAALTVFAISRDSFGNFSANVAADSWSMVSTTGGVTSGDLVAAADSKSATFTGHCSGTGKIHAAKSGLTSTDSGTLTVSDITLPVISGCPGNIVVNTGIGRATCDQVASWTAPTASDNCAVASFTSNKNPGDSFTVGTTIVTYTAKDAANNTTTCSFTVTVNDTTPPTISSCGSDQTVGANSSCQAAVPDFTAGVAATDNCTAAGSLTKTQSPAAGTMVGLGATTVTITVKDAANNSSTCTRTFTVSDTTAPTITSCGPNQSASANTSCQAAVPDFTVGVVATDNCTASGSLTKSQSPAAGTLVGFGPHTVTVTVVDAANNSSTCTATFTVNDTTSPVLSGCSDVNAKTSDDGSGNCSTAVTYAQPTALDNCDGARAVTCNPASGTVFNKGTTLVTCTASDTSGNTGTCTFNVTVTDDENPVMNCPGNLAVNTDAGKCTANVIFTATATDNCPGVTFVCSPASGTEFAKGTTTVNCTATDTSSHTATCSFTVTVNDNQGPTLTSCPANITQGTDLGMCSAVVSFTAPTASDVCDGPVSVTCTPASGSIFAKVTSTVTCSASDAAGNHASCSFTVTVNDTEDPKITCPSDITVNTDAGKCTANVTFTAAATDNCPGVTYVCSPASGSDFAKGTTTVNCTATDTSSHTAACSFTVTVNDNQAPTLTPCPANITQGTDLGVCSAVVSFTAPTASDLCDGPVSVTCAPASGSTFPKGTSTVTCSTSDAAGNNASCSFTVTVNDTEDPKITCPSDITVNTDAGKCTANVTFSAAATDNCPGVTYVCSPASGSDFAKGTTTVNCMATDTSSHTATCSFTVTVNDDQAPTLTSCPGNVTQGTDSGVCSAVVSFTAPTASDLCDGPVTVTCAPASGSTFPKGTTTVTCTALDAAANSVSCHFTVTINDTEKPVITLSGLSTVHVECHTVYTDAGAAANDNCDGNVTSSISTANPVNANVPGTYTVTYNVSDAAGNAATQVSRTVVVEDTTAPVITLNGSATLTLECHVDSYTEAGASVSDVCDTGLTTATVGGDSVNANTPGIYVVTYDATDASGNHAIQRTRTVSVTDTIAPTLTCPAPIVAEATSASGAVVTYSTPAASDACDPNPTVNCTPASGSTFAIGTTTVTCVATDANSNMGNCTFSVTVQDTIAPTVSCPANLTLEATSAAGATATFTAAASDIVDGTDSVTCSPASGSTFVIGTTTVTCTATDAHGNTGSCTFTVQVRDTTAPTVTCPTDMTLEATGAAGAAATFTATSTDIVDGTDAVTCTPASGSTFAIGNTTVACTATDAHGNTGSCTFTVQVRDTTAPIVTCPTDMTLEATGAAGAAATFTATSTDIVDGTHAVTCAPASGSTFAIGTTTVTCTATDAHGNTGTCSFSVTVQDTTPPTVTCPANMTLEATGAAGAVATFTATATDIVDGSDAVTCAPASGSTFAIGSTTVTCTATDTHGNTGNCTFTVQVRDTTAPAVTCPANMTLEATGAAGAMATFTATASDIVDGSDAVTCTPASGSTFAIGSTTVTCTATDTHGNTGNCTFTVQVRDTTAPAVTCPANMTLEATGAAGAVATFTATASDIVDGTDAVTCAPASGSTFAIGTTTVTCTATDAHGNTGTCSFSVTVQDMTAPTVTCPANMTLEATSAAGAAAIFTATATDIVDGTDAVTCSPASGSTFAIGSTAVTCTALDAHGNTGACSFSVTVQDTTPPVVSCPANMTLEATGAAGATASFTATASDIVDGTDAVTCAPASGSTFAIGATTVTCTATDAHGNTGMCSFSVTVQDTTPPVVSCPASMALEATSAAGAVAIFAASANDVVDGGDAVTCAPASGSTFAIGTTTVTCNATDEHGNTGTCSFSVTVQDTAAPTVTCPANMTLEATGAAGAVATFTATATDIVDGTDAVTCAPTSGSTFAIGTTTVTCSASDAHGNTGSCIFTVKVQDTTAPTVTCPVNMTLEATGAAGAVATFTATSSDIVDGTDAVTCTPGSGSTFAIGTTTVTCTATDAHSNTGTCNFSVTVQDTTAPTVTCPANMTLEATGAEGAVASFTATASDIVDGSVSVTCAPASGSTFAIGTTTVTCTATDAHNNTGNCNFSVTVQDTTPPTVTCPANMSLEAVSAAGASAAFAATASDLVDGTDSVTCSPASGSTFAVGTTTVTCSATDAHGNTGVCSFIVTVQDTTPPTVTCPASMTLEATSAAGATATFTVTASDSVDGSNAVACTPASGSTFPIGTTTVTCAATDSHANAGSALFLVTVQDTTPPSMSCPVGPIAEATSAAGASVTFSGSANDLVGGVLPVTCSPASGSTFAIGTTAVNCTATDSHGNSGTCSFSVKVEDTTAPHVTCPGDQTVSSTSSSGAVVAFAATASDSVSGTLTPACTPPSGTSFPIGNTPVTCSVTDAAGNGGSCTFHVIVLPGYKPAGVSCNGNPGHVILQPINTDGTSVCKQGSTIPAKFRVFDANCNSVGTNGVVSNFRLIQIINSTVVSSVNESVDSTTPDNQFRWDPTDQLWIFNVSTKTLQKNKTYVYQIDLNDGSMIQFQFGLK